jgi:hypothetical protein
MSRLKDVIFGQKALNYEEGKWTNDSKFLPSIETYTEGATDLAGFVRARSTITRYRYGDFASGSAVRLDAQNILKRIEENVRSATTSC